MIGNYVPNCYAVVPADLATIYNFPAHLPGQVGEGRTIVLIENSDVYNFPGDWQTFRTVFGLNICGSQQCPGTFVQVHPGPGCIDPGVAGNEEEAALDVEWATAAAPGANIVLASCADVFIFGGFLALQNLLQESPLPDVVSISYDQGETLLGAAYNAYINDLYASAAAAGVSVYVAAGDSGAEENGLEYGININGFASTPNNVAVGGTDFEDSYLNSNGIPYSTYWNSSNSPYYGSAKSYIPEIPWNSSCASALLTSLATNNTETPIEFCNSTAGTPYLNFYAGGGGPSGCATGTPSIQYVVSGSCAGYAKPFYQTSFPGVPKDGVRDLPDVSLLAADGLWGHYYVFCFSEPSRGVPCTGAPSGWSIAGGTSFGTPVWAGIQALLNQKINSRSGNPNYILYFLAGTDPNYLNGLCNSNSSAGPNSNCNFNDVTPSNPTGGAALTTDMDLPCLPYNRTSGPLYDCYLPPGLGYKYGVLSTSLFPLPVTPAYVTETGWDFATGIGTVNVQNLVNNWPPPPVPCYKPPGTTVCIVD